MKRLKTLAVVAGAVLMFTPRAAYADMANGSYSVDVGTDVPLWDLSESYDSDVGIGGLEFTIAQEPSGTFTGTGDLYVDDLGVSLDLSGNVSGNSTGSSTDPKISMKVFVSDSDDDESTVYINYLDVAMSLAMQVDSADDQLAGKGSGAVKYSIQNESTGKTEKGSRSAPTGSVTVPLPDDVTGDWNLTLNLTPNGTKYTGTAEVVTSVGDSVDFNVTGTYSAKKDVSDLTLKGTGWGAGTGLSLVISTSGSTINIKSVEGKLFGQSLNYKTP
jgi:hypothetical protein